MLHFLPVARSAAYGLSAKKLAQRGGGDGGLNALLDSAVRGPATGSVDAGCADEAEETAGDGLGKLGDGLDAGADNALPMPGGGPDGGACWKGLDVPDE
jgi:hypothetical protein